MSFRRRVAFQPDILEWVGGQKAALKTLRDERYKLEKGFVAYYKDFVEMMRPTPPKETPKDATPTVSPVEKAMQQANQSEELLKQMKWKRITWDDDADYFSFAKRLIDNDKLFSGAGSYSFMSVHVVKDPTMTDFVKIPQGERNVEASDLTKWFLQEREPKVVELYPTTVTAERKSAFTVDWTSGEVRILDTASALEVLTFLTTVAQRLQRVQVIMEEEQTKQKEAVEKVRVRVGAVVKFNDFDTSFWDDPKRKTDPNYIDPAELNKFLSGMLKSSVLYRYYLKGQQIRVVPPGKTYFADLDNKELQIPSNFADFNTLYAHQRFEKLERVVEAFRRTALLWLGLGMVVVGDVELF